MRTVYVKLQSNDQVGYFVVQTDRSATALDHEAIRPFLREGVELTCLRKEGAEKYGWAEEAER